MANEFTRVRCAKMTYNAPTDGGTLSTTVTPALTESLPIGAIVTGVVIQPLTNMTTASSPTIAINAGGVTICGSTPIASNATGLTTGGQDASWWTRVGAVTTAPYLPIKTTTNAPITIDVATATISAGKFNLYVFYID